MIPDFHQTVPIDQIGVEERVARFRTRSIKKESKLFALKMALRMVDLTTLEGMDSPGKVRQLCHKALYPHKLDSDIPRVAAICVYPNRVRLAADILKGSGIHVASVATSFPSGMSTLEGRTDEVKFAVDEGADEIDMVISRWAFLKGDYQHIFDEVATIKEACGPAHLKVILETGELETYENVRKASDIAIYAGADFIKTSTGKISPAATMPVTLVMLYAIRDYYFKTGNKIGMKPAGGIRDAKTALHYLVMVKETLGADWLTPDLFRFGASSLANDLLMQIVKQITGHYQSSDYFTIG
ncbi:MAG: deoxyribose-phosphate aldolase [Cyclonatronaceae bacterium]